MRFAVLFLALVTTAVAAPKKFELYAMFLQDTRVELSDGAVWMMDKGDVFPVDAYKNQQRNIVLRLAGATFMTATERVRILKPEEVPAGLEVYRNNVRAYLESTADKIKEMIEAENEAKGGNAAAAKDEQAKSEDATGKKEAEASGE
jgi:hypothetical protein